MSARLTRAAPIAALGLASLASGCGDPIVAGSYRGEALYQIEGWVQLTVSPSELLGSADDAPELRVAVLWSQTKGSSFNLEGAVEQEVVATGTFPARFDVTLYEPPDADILRAVPGGTGEMAIAALVAYVDLDGDEHWDRDSEDLVGGAEDRLFLYTPDGLTSDVFGDLEAGFHRLVPTAACDGPLAGDGGHTAVHYAVDTAEEIDLSVDGQFPMSALFDVDCDPSTFDWAGTCPPLDAVRKDCRGGGGMVADPSSAMCQACDDKLWPADAQGDPDACDAWFFGCLLDAPPWECEFEWHVCRGESPGGPHPEDHCDLRCVCDHVYDECRAHGGSDSECNAQAADCLQR